MRNKLYIKYVFALLAILLLASLTVIFFKQKKLLSVSRELKSIKRNNLFYLPSPTTIPLEHLSLLDILDKSALAHGANIMSQHKVVICGIARDNAEDLSVVMKHIEHIGQAFSDYRVVIFENDSKDGTKAILQNWQRQNQKVNIQSKDFKNTKRPNIKFLADIRNNYLEIIDSDIEYNDFDILMVVDMDMSYGFDIRGIEHSFSKFDQWDAVCSNGIYNRKGQMYDVFAFRNEEFPMKPSDNPEKYWTEIIYKAKKAYPVNSDLIPVDSCFGGLAFYKRKFIKSCRYDSIDDDCEHVLFHQCLREKNGGRMFMNPAQVIKYSDYKD
jgi:hypothetical protein